MSTGDRSLTSARARRREMALDPRDVEARATFYQGLRERRGARPRSVRARLVWGAAVTIGLIAVAVTGFVLWNSAIGTSARAELGTAGSDLTAWAEAQVSGTDVASPTEPAILPATSVARITGTSGRGVAIRDRCVTDARTGRVIGEGTVVMVLEAGEGACAGWSLVSADGGASWVHDRYLVHDERGPEAS